MNTNNTNRNPSFRPGQREVDSVSKSARASGRDGAVVGGVGGYIAGGLASRRLRKARLAGAAVGAVTGHVVGKVIGRRAAARDDVASRRALLQNNALAAIDEKLTHLESRAERLGFETIDDATAMKPRSRSGQDKNPWYPRVRGVGEVGDGLDAEGLAKLTPERQALADEFGWGVVNSLPDELLTRENCAALRDEVLKRQDRADQPAAGLRSGEDFERDVLSTHLGSKVVSSMGPAEVHAHYMSAQRRGLISLEDMDETTDFGLVDRIRNDQGEFVDNEVVSPEAIQRAYHPRDRRTGIEAGGAGLAAGAGLAGAIAHLRGRKGKRPRLTGGSVPQLGFAAQDDGSHPVRDTLAGVGAGALGAAALLALRKRRQLRLPRLAPGSGKVIDVPATTFGMGSPGSYIIRRATLRGKKPPTNIRRVSVGKAKPKHHGLAFLIHDDAPEFRLTPQAPQKLAPGMRQRVKPARTRKEVIERLKQITALSSREFGTGNLVGSLAGDAIDAVVGGSLAGETPAQRRARQQRIQAQQQNVADDSDIANDSTAQPRTLDSALDRLASMDFSVGGAIARGAAKYLPEAAVIGSADLVAERANAGIEARKKRQKRLMRQGGIQATPSMGGAPTTMSAILGVVQEFDYGVERTARAKRNGTTIAAAGAGGVAGAVGGLKYDQGRPVAHSDLKPGDRVYRRFGPGGLFQHAGIVGQDGKITHRTSGSATYRAIKPDSFTKTGKAPTYRENNPADVSRAKAAKNASKAAGTRAGKYCVGSNNCQTAVERIASKGRPVSGQLRRAGIGAAIGAAGLGSVAHILNNRRKDK